MEKRKKALNIKRFVLYCLATFIFLFALAFSIVFVMEKELREAEFDEIVKHEEQIIETEFKFIASELYSAVSDLLFITRIIKDTNRNPYNIEKADQWLTEFSTQRGVYENIFYITKDFTEVININLDGQIPDAMEFERNQEFGKVAFFDKIHTLPEGSVYISPVGIEPENSGVFGGLPKPIVVVATPVYDDSGEFMGVASVGFLADNMLKSFIDVSATSYGEFFLLNESGGYISSEEVTDTFLPSPGEYAPEYVPDMFGDNYEEWELMTKFPNETLSEKGLFIYDRMNLPQMIDSADDRTDVAVYMDEQYWYAVSIIRRDGPMEDIFTDYTLRFALDIVVDYKVPFIAMFFVSMLIGWVIYMYRSEYSRTKFYSEHDSLTGAYNRRSGMKRLEEMLQAGERTDFALSLCFVDIDGLKKINDVVGHGSGDEVLITVADVLKSHVRESDYVIRMGGDEFLIVFTRLDAQAAENVWKRIQGEFDSINEKQERPYIISVSHGVADCYGSDCVSTALIDLIHEADEKMYEEKRTIKAGNTVIRQPAN